MLRANLDESLLNVSLNKTQSTQDMRRALDKETNRLRQSTNDFELKLSPPGIKSSPSKIKRHLSFDNLGN